VIELITKAKDIGINSAIETCGIGAESFYEKCSDLECVFLFDIKGIDGAKHKKHTGVVVEKIHKNLDLLMDRGAKIIIRMPLIPGYNDTDNDLALLSAFLKERKDRIEYAEIMPYHDLGNEKRRSLGLEADTSIPNGRDYTNRWSALLSDSGTEIKISGS
jgi:pyruvate formate lyase activating enzyme